MTDIGISDVALHRAERQLTRVLNLVDSDQEIAGIRDAKDEVILRYQPIFAFDNVPNLTEEEFQSFLLFRNNRHWSGLHRQQKYITEDMQLLKQALSILVDESRPVSERLNQLRPSSGSPMVPKLGRAVLTAILHVEYPDQYGVWNGTSEAGMRSLDIWPSFEWGSSFGERYVQVNEILKTLASSLEIDLWTLDALWWRVKRPSEAEVEEETSVIEFQEEYQRFGLERYLQEFIADNWNGIQHFDGWDLYEEDGEILGVEYDTGEIGRIDLLARHRTEPKWMVVELKRDQTSDQTIGQVLRYMGWVKENKANVGEEVGGLVICHASDKRLELALKYTQGVNLMFYEVDFQLKPSR